MAEDRSVLTRVAQAPDLSLRYGPADDHVTDLWLGDARAAHRPLVLLIHGGFWRSAYDRTHLRPAAAALRDAGWSVGCLEYRCKPGCPDLAVDDVALAVRAVPAVLAEEIGAAGTSAVDRAAYDSRVLVAGHSAGGHLALWASVVAPAPCLVATVGLAPVADLGLAHRLWLDDGAVADFLGGAAQDRPDLDPVRLSGPRTPIVIVHGGEDELVPIGLAESYAAVHPATRLVPVSGAAHFAVIDPLSAAWPVVLAELARFDG